MKTSTSKGHDGISSELLKLITSDVSKCITTIINQSLTSGIFPNSLKIAKVTPIFKQDAREAMRVVFYLYLQNVFVCKIQPENDCIECECIECECIECECIE